MQLCHWSSIGSASPDIATLFLNGITSPVNPTARRSTRKKLWRPSFNSFLFLPLLHNPSLFCFCFCLFVCFGDFFSSFFSFFFPFFFLIFFLFVKISLFQFSTFFQIFFFVFYNNTFFLNFSAILDFDHHHHHHLMLTARIPLALSFAIHPNRQSLVQSLPDGIQCPHKTDECKSIGEHCL